ncbi:hypothetical protein ACPC5U_12925 [Acinetobacter haemolyticus]|uniref:hypothetical protein n=1 Tax=Acinetobacter haemolyticus TaxID=29430 RepID=UPI003C1FBEB9
MGNRWNADKEPELTFDEKALSCPFCGYEHGVVVDTELFPLEELGNVWSARTICHECGSQGPSTGIATWPDHPLHNERLYIDWEDEREVVNFAIKIWNCRY